MTALETFLRALRETKASDQATPENSYLPHLKPLLEAALEGVTPKLTVLTHPKKVSGAGLADSGLVESGSNDLTSAVEAEAPTTSLEFPATTPKGKTAWEQAERYSKNIGPTLLTNFLEFVLVVDGLEVRRVSLGTWEDVTGNPASTAKTLERDLYDLLNDWATRRRPITKPADLAARLADYARLSLRRLEQRPDPGLEHLKATLDSALGLHFNEAQGEHFFRSTLIQTLYYGLFSAFVLWVREGHTPKDFRWKDASDFLKLPVISAIFEEVSKVSTLKKLGIREPLEWAEKALQRVDAQAFFAAFAEVHAIQYFYEPFLEAFDPELRDQLGVWYTPPEVVAYQVRKVHALLQSELGLEDGLADPSVIVLDPATGTGSYLLEVARQIHTHLLGAGKAATAAARLKEAMTKRVFGFEILPAPFVVAHLQLGLLLQSLGAPLEPGERAGVYLTNSLTGWDPKDEAKQRLDFVEFQQEREAAGKVKRNAKILVMIGNPPYNRFSGVAEDEEGDLIAPYKVGLHEKWGVKKQLLDDLYIRFFRLAEWRISENQQRRGVVSYISNSSWLEGLSHPVMRESILRNFDKIWVDNLNGDKFKTGKRTPWGSSDQSIFSTEQDARGIQVGAAIVTMVDQGLGEDIAGVEYREFWGLAREKNAALLENTSEYKKSKPSASTRWVLLPIDGDKRFLNWLKVPEIFPRAFQGLNSNRDGGVIAFDKEVLEARMKSYFDPNVSFEEMRSINETLVSDAARFDPVVTRELLLLKSAFREDRVIPHNYRPFDTRWVYWEELGKLLNEKRPDFFAQVFPGNIFFNTTGKHRRAERWDQLSVSTQFTDLHIHNPDAQVIPLYLRVSDMFSTHLEPNLSAAVLEAMCALTGATFKPGGPHAPEVLETAEAVFYHAVAVMQSPAYRTENDGYLRQDWPRIPLPKTKTALLESALLGRRVAALLQPGVRVDGVTHKLDAQSQKIAVPIMADGSVIAPGKNLEITVSYGGKGKFVPRGETGTGDLWWSNLGCWSNVPKSAWEFSIGGYPVIKKWLSYRHVNDLGRPLNLDELEFVSEMIRRILALLEMTEMLDANYHALV